jgi:hypothetical protein
VGLLLRGWPPGRSASYAEPDKPRDGDWIVDGDRRPDSLVGVVLDAYWTSLAHDPVPALLLTALLSLAGVLAVLLGHILVELVGQLVRALT